MNAPLPTHICVLRRMCKLSAAVCLTEVDNMSNPPRVDVDVQRCSRQELFHDRLIDAPQDLHRREDLLSLLTLLSAYIWRAMRSAGPSPSLPCTDS